MQLQLSRRTPTASSNAPLPDHPPGFGQPSVFNTDAVVEELLRQGKTVEDARRAAARGCVEVGAFGKEAYILTGYFNLPKISRSRCTTASTRAPASDRPQPATRRSFAALTSSVRRVRGQLRHFVDIKIRGNQVIERLYAR
jgi:hypothetical protein